MYQILLLFIIILEIHFCSRKIYQANPGYQVEVVSSRGQEVPLEEIAPVAKKTGPKKIGHILIEVRSICDRVRPDTHSFSTYFTKFCVLIGFFK